jgi:hypothetical protein
VAGYEVGMQVGLHNVGNINPLGSGFIDVNVDITLGVDYGTAVFTGKDVRTVGNFAKEKMFQQHFKNLL